MEQQSVTSAKYALNFKDILRGLLMAVGTPVIYEIQKVLDSGSFDFNWKHLAMIGVGAGIVYLIKNFFSGATIKTPVDSTTAENSTLPPAAK